MSQELRMVEQNRYDDEIDLYELIEILLRNKFVIIITAMLIFILSGIVAYYDYSKSLVSTTVYTKEYFINRDGLNIEISNETTGTKKNMKGIIEPANIFKKNSRINSFFSIDEIKQNYNGLDDYDSKREYLNKIFKINEKKIDRSENSILIVKISEKQFGKNIESFFNKYEENLKLSAIAFYPNEEVQIQATSDVYKDTITSKTKAKLILAVGAVMGVFLGIMMAFLKEFIDGYKKRYQKVK